MNTPSLFDAIEGNVVRDIHARMEASNAEWMASVRHGFGFDYAGRVVTTDDLWAWLDRNEIDLPAGASPNLLGSFFSGWDRATATGAVIRSDRKDAHGNWLRVWKLV